VALRFFARASRLCSRSSRARGGPSLRTTRVRFNSEATIRLRRACRREVYADQLRLARSHHGYFAGFEATRQRRVVCAGPAGYDSCPMRSNQTPERTADRRRNLLSMISTLKGATQLALAWILSKTPAYAPASASILCPAFRFAAERRDSLVRFASSRSRTPAVLLCNGSGRSASSR
jgi:hypothetical protein